MTRARNSVAVLSLLLMPAALPADVTLRYTTELTPNPALPAAFTQALTPRLESLSRGKTVLLKGGLLYSKSGLSTTIVDSAREEITVLDPAHRHYATLAFSQYADEIARGLQQPAAGAQSALSAMKMTSDARPTGRVAEIAGIQAEEHEFVMSLSGPVGPNASAGPIMRVVMQAWMATPEALARNPALREFADSATRKFSTEDMRGVFGKILSQFPGLAEGLSSHLAEVAAVQSVTLRTHVEIFMPMLAVLAARTPGAANPFGGMDPNSALLSTNDELAEISAAPIADSAFRIPEGYTAVPLAEIMSSMRPQPKPATPPPASGLIPPSVLEKVDPVYTEEARQQKISGSVMLSIVVGVDGKARDIQIVRSLEPTLDQKAVEAVEKWVFRPGTKNGTPVSVRSQVEINFRLLARPSSQP